MDINRRNFLKKTSRSLAFGVAGQALLRPLAAAAQAATEVSAHGRPVESRSGDMLYRTLGRTKEKVSVIGLGGYHMVVITGIDNTGVLNQAIEAVRTFKPMTKDEIANLLGRTRAAAANGQFERYKVSQHFDGTAHNPQWLG